MGRDLGTTSNRTRTSRQGRDAHPLARSLQRVERRSQLSATLERVHADVWEGLGHEEFFLVYQPRVDLRTGETAGVEALLRWDDADRGLIGPRAFLTSVKQTAAMIPLGRWVLEESCRQAARWEAQRPLGARPLQMSVNVTALEVLERGFAGTLLATLDHVGLPIEALQIEVDAADQIGGDATLALRLQSLRHRGLRVAVDNVGPSFGLGRATIAVDAVHIDRRWVRALGDDVDVLAALRDLVDRAHGAGARVCASGVQTEAERRALVAIGCDDAQGFLFCPPVEPHELDWLEDPRP